MSNILPYTSPACANIGSEYTADELEFMQAIQAYKKKHNRPFPTWHEVLAIVKSLGYRKCAEPTEIPKPRGAFG